MPRKKFIKYQCQKNGKVKFEFFELDIYDLLRENGFRYTKIRNKGRFLKSDKGVYKVCNFQDLKDFFVEHIEDNFENLGYPKEIEKEFFINQIYARRPIKKGNYARDYLGEDFELLPQNLDLILEKLYPEIKNEKQSNEIVKFLNSEGFIEAIDTIDNFKKGGELFYKKISDSQYLVFIKAAYSKRDKLTTYDFWKVEAQNEQQFLSKKIDTIDRIRGGFKLQDFEEAYKEAINKAKSLY
jgi:ribosomal protein S8